MSILIKDMEMPETCEECSFHCYHSDGEYVCVATPLFYPMNLANSKGIRKDWCPLVEVPTPHGDLIDRDVLEREMLNGIKAGNLEEGYEMHVNINTMDDCVECVRWADAVIEVEGEDE